MGKEGIGGRLVEEGREDERWEKEGEGRKRTRGRKEGRKGQRGRTEGTIVTVTNAPVTSLSPVCSGVADSDVGGAS